MIAVLFLLSLLSDEVPVQQIAAEDRIALQSARIELTRAQEKYGAILYRIRYKHDLYVPVDHDGKRYCGTWDLLADQSAFVFLKNDKDDCLPKKEDTQP